jgi:endo-1,4-beta-xylanase
MKKRNIPIDGVGIQYHVGINVQPKFEKINNLISRYCKLGVEVHITELDVSCDDNCRDADGGESKQGQVYTNALKACLNNSCCTGFLVWGIGDKDSWRGVESKPLLFDANYQPKGQYTAILNTLKSTPAASLNGNPYSENPSYDIEPENKAVKLNDGWYYIKNTGSGKYLNVKDGKAASTQNVVIGSSKQKWKLTNNSDNTVTLLSEVGDFMLDVNGGSSDNGANIQIYNAYGGDAQKFVIRETSQANVYVVSTKVSSGYKVLDVENEGKYDGSNICQWENGERSNQTWTFESAGGSSNDDTPTGSACWSVGLGYQCCKSCNVEYKDNDGEWGIENNKWCGISKDCATQNSNSCVGAQGYPCCKSTCDVYSTDNDGKWGIENNDWCLIDKSKC